MTTFLIGPAALAQIGGKTAADGPFLLDDAEDLDMIADGVMRFWLPDNVAGPAMDVTETALYNVTLAPGQSPTGLLKISVPSRYGYINGGFGVPVPAVAGESTLTAPGDITSFDTLRFLFCYTPADSAEVFQVVLETYPGPTYPNVYWSYTPIAGTTFHEINIDLWSPDLIENAGGLSLHALLSQTRFLYFYFYKANTSFHLRLDGYMDDIRLLALRPTVTPTPAPDADEDGVPDAVEGYPPAPGQTNRYLDDSDGDGLGDGAEDANANGVRDAGETDARNADSDGDGLMDGIETGVLATDPLSAISPATYADADGDGLPASHDGQEGAPDQDGDRFKDGYEAAMVGLGAEANAGLFPQLGDANLDTFVSNIDALIVQSLFMGNITPEAAVFQGRGFRNADPNRDGFISNIDALIAQSYFLDNLPLLPL